MNHILLLDDEENILYSLHRLLKNIPCTCDGVTYPLHIEVFHDPFEALQHVKEHALDLVISDYRMPGMDGVTFLRKCREIQPSMARMIISGYADMNGMIGAINEAHIYRFLQKPWGDYELVANVGQCLAHHHLKKENRRLADLARLHELTANQE
ncbi:MAG: response regulator [Formivibrio sp.]|nr:response regulator [Formivibrio sp.]